MYQIHPKQECVPNAIFAHGDIAVFLLTNKGVLMSKSELRVKDLDREEPLDEEPRNKLYLKNGYLTVDARVWPVSRHECDHLEWQLVKVLGDVHTPKYPAFQGGR